MSSSTFHHHRQSTRSSIARRGFTLVELLIVIAIIGILVGLVLAVGRGAVTRAQEFAVSTEITQMNQAVESFKTKYGFYPPSFEQFTKTNSDAMDSLQILPFLNRIAPNHQESGAQLTAWWATVGKNLNQTTSLQFWLSGMAQNKQFPLTNPATGSPLSAWDDGNVARENFFDFDSTRLTVDPLSASALSTRRYTMAHGKQNGDLFYAYRDSASYEAGGPAYHFLNGTTRNFINPNTFQLISAGLDGEVGLPTNTAFLGNIQMQGVKAADNLCNFSGSGGRLDRYVTENEN